MKLYGSLNNRLEEGQQFVKEIKVGDGVTEYGYTDRYPYEVTDVIDQKHIFIRSVDSKRVDNNGMSECQYYEYVSNENNPKIELVKRNGIWYKVREHSKEKWLQRANNLKDDFKSIEIAYKYIRCMSGLTQKQLENIELGKIVRQYKKMDISIGKMEQYFDYSF